jgi:CHAD domain-containing protein
MKAIAPTVRPHATNLVSPDSAPSLLDCQTAFQQIAKGCLNLIRSHRSAAIAADEEAIHIIRIELTRLRGAVHFFSPMTTDESWPGINKELHWLNSALGKARDRDVTMNYALRKRYRRWAKSSRRALKRMQNKSHRGLGQQLASARYNNLLLALDQIAGRRLMFIAKPICVPGGLGSLGRVAIFGI